MMNRRIVMVPLLALAGTALSGCVAVAIPALAGSAMVGTRIDGKDAGEESKPAASAPAPAVAAAAPRPAPSPNPTVTVLPGASAPPPPAAAKAPVITPAPVEVAAPVAAAVPPPPPAPAPVVRIPAAPAPSVAPAPAAAPVVTMAPPPAPVSTASVAAAVPPPPAAPAVPDAVSTPRPAQFGFSQFVRYGRGVAAVSAGATGPLSAMLADPYALDGQRKRCAAGEQPVVVIDLDPAGGVFDPPADPERIPGHALGLAVLRDAGVQIAWLSDLPVAQIGAVRTALEFAGLDPRGQDIVSLRRDPDDRKQARKESLAASSCLIAIAGDAKPDFDERFLYLKNPEAGKALEAAIGDGWFLIEPIFPVAK